MRFCEIVGQEEVKRQLCQAVRDGRIAHAQLFTGISGVGKLSLALASVWSMDCILRTYFRGNWQSQGGVRRYSFFCIYANNR